MIETTLDLEWLAPWLSKGVRRVPETVRDLRCSAQRNGDLFFSWGPPRKMTPVEGYRIERTRNGHAYEQVADTPCCSFKLPRPALNDGWFYRVTAFNEAGQGRAEAVYFYLRRQRNSILQVVLVRPGLRVNIYELIPQ